MWERSPLSIQGVDYDELAKYLGSNLSPIEILNENISHLVYKKKSKKKNKLKKKMKEKLNKNRKTQKKSNKKHKKEKMKKQDGAELPKYKKTKDQIFNEKWAKPKNSPNPVEKVKLIGIALERLIVVSMSNHIYSFKNVNRVQKKGGATGLDITGILADLVMIWWDKQFQELIEHCQLQMDLFVRFKDDANILADKIMLASQNLKNILGADFVDQDHFEGNPEDYTAAIFCKLADKVCDMISFTFDTPTMHEDQKLPVLDLKIFLNEDNKIRHEFYEKPTRNQRVILPSSALSWGQKRTIHTQELIRRLKNTSFELGQEIQNAHITKYLLRMKICGYSEKFRMEVLLSAQSAYRKIIETSKSENISVYRNRSEMLLKKAQKNKSACNWWQKTTTSGKAHTGILFVPPTPHGVLAKMLRKREAELNSQNKMKIKIVEKGGIKMKHIFVKSNPYPKEKCEVKDCPFCEPSPQIITNPKDNCQSHNIGYKFSCTLCDMTYEGESFRKISVRGREHVRALRNNSKENPLVKHISKHHPLQGGQTIFKLSITGQFNNALSRQADEAVRIQETAGLNMNSKSEFNAPKISRVLITDAHS